MVPASALNTSTQSACPSSQCHGDEQPLNSSEDATSGQPKTASACAQAISCYLLVLYTPPYVLVDSVQTMQSLCGVHTDSLYLIHLSKVHMDSMQTPHGLRMDFAQMYILQ
jgi:hypothetical protein